MDNYIKENDFKRHIVNGNSTLVENYPDGYGFIIPSNKVRYNYDNSIYVCKYYFNNSILTTSYENKNPYGYQGKKGWDIYYDEWLTRYIANEDFLKGNNIEHTKENQNLVVGNLNIITFSLHINEDANIEYPYYNIAIIKTLDSIVDFYLYVMKSKVNVNDEFESIYKSFQLIERKGKATLNNEIKEISLPNLNEETLNYYNKLKNQNTVDWGIFRKCIANEKDGAYDYYSKYYEENHDRFDKMMNHKFELLPTYMHISWAGNFNYFPLNMALKYAGGNGFNGKKVLHFTMQYTTDNNKMGISYSPTFDILRGKFDDYFRQLARDIKEYRHPVLFRLNNEMNTDWTSYSGIMSLLDPDIFVLNWKRLYDIFQEEGVDNCIWIFNPIAITTPYSNWGEFINYYPKDMMQLMGLTFYERGNDKTYGDFNEMYTYLLKEYDVFFKKFPKIISEFGAGSGGEVLYNYSKGKFEEKEKFRNANNQANWVKNMFVALNENDLLKEIKAAVWFSCNDYAYIDGKQFIMNNFNLTEELVDTIKEFDKGLNQD